jgi:hypothetical protein
MSGRGYRATIALTLALCVSTVLTPTVASAGEYRDQPSMSVANQQQALLFLLTMLTVAKTTISHADQLMAGYVGTSQPARVLYADAQDSKDWVHGAD